MDEQESLGAFIPEVIRPFRDEEELRKVTRSLHNLIWAEGHDDAKSFDELTKVLFLKLYDERENSDNYEFKTLQGEKTEDTAERIRKLFEELAKSPQYGQAFHSRFGIADTRIELNDFTICRAVRELEGYSLMSTSKKISGVDIKGIVFEQIVGHTFRGKLGEFFTPRPMVEFMVKMLDPKIDHRVLDPACGSGGFLIWVINAVKDHLKDDKEMTEKITHFAENNVFGVDINERMFRVAKMNMLMHGYEPRNIFNIDGLFVPNHAPDEAKMRIKYNSFDLIFSNPPFAGRVDDPKILELFEMGRIGGKTRSVTKEVLFVERIVKLLKPGGKAALVLPRGILSNKELKYVRDWIKKHCQILALIALPDFAFLPSGTGVKGALVFLKKKEEPVGDYKIFVKKVDRIGYTSTARPDKNEFLKVLDDHKNSSPEDLVSFSELDACFGYTDTGRIDPRFFLWESRRKLKVFEDSPYPFKRIGNVTDFRNERFTPKREDLEKEFIYIQISDVDVKEGKIIPNKRRAKNFTQSVQLMREGDIVISRRTPDRGAVAIVPKELDGGTIITEFSVLKPKKEIVNPEYLHEFLRTRQFLDLLGVYVTGELSQRISEEDLQRIGIPVPPKEVQDELMEEIKKAKEEAKKLVEEARSLVRKAKLRIERIAEGHMD